MMRIGPPTEAEVRNREYEFSRGHELGLMWGFILGFLAALLVVTIMELLKGIPIHHAIGS